MCPERFLFIGPPCQTLVLAPLHPISNPIPPRGFHSLPGAFQYTTPWPAPPCLPAPLKFETSPPAVPGFVGLGERIEMPPLPPKDRLAGELTCNEFPYESLRNLKCHRSKDERYSCVLTFDVRENQKLRFFNFNGPNGTIRGSDILSIDNSDGISVLSSKIDGRYELHRTARTTSSVPDTVTFAIHRDWKEGSVEIELDGKVITIQIEDILKANSVRPATPQKSSEAPQKGRLPLEIPIPKPIQPAESRPKIPEQIPRAVPEKPELISESVRGEKPIPLPATVQEIPQRNVESVREEPYPIGTPKQEVREGRLPEPQSSENAPMVDQSSQQVPESPTENLQKELKQRALYERNRTIEKLLHPIFGFEESVMRGEYFIRVVDPNTQSREVNICLRLKNERWEFTYYPPETYQWVRYHWAPLDKDWRMATIGEKADGTPVRPMDLDFDLRCDHSEKRFPFSEGRRTVGKKLDFLSDYMTRDWQLP